MGNEGIQAFKRSNTGMVTCVIRGFSENTSSVHEIASSFAGKAFGTSDHRTQRAPQLCIASTYIKVI